MRELGWPQFHAGAILLLPYRVQNEEAKPRGASFEDLMDDSEPQPPSPVIGGGRGEDDGGGSGPSKGKLCAS